MTVQFVMPGKEDGHGDGGGDDRSAPSVTSRIAGTGTLGTGASASAAGSARAAQRRAASAALGRAAASLAKHASISAQASSPMSSGRAWLRKHAGTYGFVNDVPTKSCHWTYR